MILTRPVVTTALANGKTATPAGGTTASGTETVATAAAESTMTDLRAVTATATATYSRRDHLAETESATATGTAATEGSVGGACPLRASARPPPT